MAGRLWQSILSLLKASAKLIRASYRWLIINWHLVIGLMLLFGVAYGSFVLTQSLWAIALILGLACAAILLTRSLYPTSGRHFEVLPLPVGKFANATLKGKYENLPQGEVNLGGVTFLLTPEAYAFDTSQARYIEPDGSVRAELKLPQPVGKVKSVHLLINAGGAFRTDPDSNTPLEWLRIGRIQLIFKDTTSQETELILGGNVREWAIGNFPGKLVDRIDEPFSQVAWRGKNTSGKCAVIDRLEIPVLESNRSKQLESVVFIRDIPWKAPSSEGGKLHFFVSAVTLEKC